MSHPDARKSIDLYKPTRRIFLVSIPLAEVSLLGRKSIIDTIPAGMSSPHFRGFRVIGGDLSRVLYKFVWDRVLGPQRPALHVI